MLYKANPEKKYNRSNFLKKGLYLAEILLHQNNFVFINSCLKRACSYFVEA